MYIHPHRLTFFHGDGEELLVGGFEGAGERRYRIGIRAPGIHGRQRNPLPRGVLEQHERQNEIRQTIHIRRTFSCPYVNSKPE
jgi:hypothetical protein